MIAPARTPGPKSLDDFDFARPRILRKLTRQRALVGLLANELGLLFLGAVVVVAGAWLKGVVTLDAPLMLRSLGCFLAACLLSPLWCLAEILDRRLAEGIERLREEHRALTGRDPEC